MSTVFLIGFFVGLAYIVGIVLTFRLAARELESTKWVIITSLVWPLSWLAFGVMYVYLKIEDLHIRVGKKGWPR